MSMRKLHVLVVLTAFLAVPRQDSTFQREQLVCVRRSGDDAALGAKIAAYLLAQPVLALRTLQHPVAPPAVSEC
jgi:hypothetical protein